MRKYTSIVIWTLSKEFYYRPHWGKISNAFSAYCSNRQLLIMHNNWIHIDVGIFRRSQKKHLNKSLIIFRNLEHAIDKFKSFGDIIETTSQHSERKQRKGSIVCQIFIFEWRRNTEQQSTSRRTWNLYYSNCSTLEYPHLRSHF